MNSLFTFKQLGYFCSIAAFVSVLTGCNSSGSVAEPEVIRPVRAQQVKIEDYQQTYRYTGTVQARHTSDLSFRVAGKITQRYVNVGDSVKAGQLLARIDPTDYQLNVLSSKAQVTAAEADYQKASTDLKRYKSLLKKQVISRDQYDQVLTRFNTTKAQLKQKRALLNVNANQATYTDLYTEKAGVVTEIPVEVGQVVAQGQKVVRIAQPQQQDIVVNIPENRLDSLYIGKQVSIDFWALPNLILQGKVREISPKSDPITRLYTVKVTLTNTDPRVHLGMTANINTIHDTVQKIVLLPLSAIYEKENMTSVWVVDSNTEKVHLIPVNLGQFIDNSISVTSGLSTGQWVVTAGTHKLHEGQTVRLLKNT